MNHILKCHDIVKTDFAYGENCSLYDEAGKRYVDFESGIWCTALGYSHPRINRAMERQLQKINHLGTRYPSMIAEEAAKETLAMTGIDNGKCVFLSSGSEAVEFGVKIARSVANRPFFLTFSNSYLAAYGSAGKKSPDEWILLSWEDGDYDHLLKSLPFEKIGGFVLEPGGSGSGFVKFPPKKLVEMIATRVKQDGGILVANEITTGFGRTGKWFGFQHYDIQPDIVALGKGIGNGYPVSAVAINRDIAEKFENSGSYYAQSHQNDPLGCAVVKEVITILREENWVEKGGAIGAYFLERLKQLEENFDVVKEARGRGLLLALEFHPHKQVTPTFLYQALFQKGFLVGYYEAGNILRFDPALTIGKEDIDSLLENLESILRTAG